MKTENGPGTASETAISITLDLKARPCDDRAPLNHIIEERRKEKLRQHLYPGNIMMLLLGR